MSDQGPLEQLRARFTEILAGLEHPPLGAATALAEECGEVAKLLLDHHAYGKAMDVGELGGELCDVLICLFEIATLHGVDLDAAIAAKDADLSRRAPKWREQLGEALKKSRGDASSADA